MNYKIESVREQLIAGSSQKKESQSHLRCTLDEFKEGGVPDKKTGPTIGHLVIDEISFKNIIQNLEQSMSEDEQNQKNEQMAGNIFDGLKGMKIINVQEGTPASKQPSEFDKASSNLYVQSLVEPSDIPPKEFNQKMAQKLQQATKKLLKEPVSVLKDCIDEFSESFIDKNTRVQVFIDHRYDYQKLYESGKRIVFYIFILSDEPDGTVQLEISNLYVEKQFDQAPKIQLQKFETMTVNKSSEYCLEHNQLTPHANGVYFFQVTQAQQYFDIKLKVFSLSTNDIKTVMDFKLPSNNRKTSTQVHAYIYQDQNVTRSPELTPHKIQDDFMKNRYFAITEDQQNHYFVTTTRKLSDPEYILLETFDQPRHDLPPIFRNDEKSFGQFPPFRVESQLFSAFATESKDMLECFSFIVTKNINGNLECSGQAKSSQESCEFFKADKDGLSFRCHLDQQIRTAYKSNKNGWIHDLKLQVEIFDHFLILDKLNMKSSTGIALLNGMIVLVTARDIYLYEFKQDGFSISKQCLLSQQFNINYIAQSEEMSPQTDPKNFNGMQKIFYSKKFNNLFLIWHPNVGYSFYLKIKKEFIKVPLGQRLNETRAAIIQEQFLQAQWTQVNTYEDFQFENHEYKEKLVLIGDQCDRLDNIEAGVGYHIVFNPKGKLEINDEKDPQYDHFFEKGPFISTEKSPHTPLLVISTEATSDTKSKIEMISFAIMGESGGLLAQFPIQVQKEKWIETMDLQYSIQTFRSRSRTSKIMKNIKVLKPNSYRPFIQQISPETELKQGGKWSHETEYGFQEPMEKLAGYFIVHVFRYRRNKTFTKAEIEFVGIKVVICKQAHGQLQTYFDEFNNVQGASIELLYNNYLDLKHYPFSGQVSCEQSRSFSNLTNCEYKLFREEGKVRGALISVEFKPKVRNHLYMLSQRQKWYILEKRVAFELDTVPDELEFVSKSLNKNQILRQFSNYSNLECYKKPFQIQKMKTYELEQLYRKEMSDHSLQSLVLPNDNLQKKQEYFQNRGKSYSAHETMIEYISRIDLNEDFDWSSATTEDMYFIDQALEIQFEQKKALKNKGFYEDDPILKTDADGVSVISHCLEQNDFDRARVLSKLLRNCANGTKAREMMMSCSQQICETKDMLEIFGWFFIQQDDNQINIQVPLTMRPNFSDQKRSIYSLAAKKVKSDEDFYKKSLDFANETLHSQKQIHQIDLFYSNISSLGLTKFTESIKEDLTPSTKITKLDIANINYNIINNSVDTIDIRFAREWTKTAYKQVSIYQKMFFIASIIAFFFPLVTLLSYNLKSDFFNTKIYIKILIGCLTMTLISLVRDLLKMETMIGELLCGLWYSIVLAINLFKSNQFHSFLGVEGVRFVNFSLVLVAIYKLFTLLKETFDEWAHLIIMLEKCLHDLIPFSILFLLLINIFVIIQKINNVEYLQVDSDEKYVKDYFNLLLIILKSTNGDVETPDIKYCQKGQDNEQCTKATQFIIWLIFILQTYAINILSLNFFIIFIIESYKSFSSTKKSSICLKNKIKVVLNHYLLYSYFLRLESFDVMILFQKPIEDEDLKNNSSYLRRKLQANDKLAKDNLNTLDTSINSLVSQIQCQKDRIQGKISLLEFNNKNLVQKASEDVKSQVQEKIDAVREDVLKIAELLQ